MCGLSAMNQHPLGQLGERIQEGGRVMMDRMEAQRQAATLGRGGPPGTGGTLPAPAPGVGGSGGAPGPWGAGGQVLPAGPNERGPVAPRSAGGYINSAR